jgi:hypothetical protein
MGIYKEIYEFSAKAGALEGYVYPKEKTDLNYLPQWVDHLVNQYRGLPAEVREEIQDLCTGTLGRAIRSLLPALGEESEVIQKLKSIASGELPLSPNDFTYRR